MEVVRKLKSKLKKYFKNEKSGHDISHLERVFDYALKIQKKEGGDLYTIAVAALVHDVHRLMASEVGHYVNPEESLDKVKEILLECEVDKSKINDILEVVKNHEDKNKKDFPIETLIVQDADLLDALGKVGLKRTLTYCKNYQIPISRQDIPLDSKEYIANINPISTCHYIYNTLLPQSKSLYTLTAREIAKNKNKPLVKFLRKHYNLSVNLVK